MNVARVRGRGSAKTGCPTCPCILVCFAQHEFQTMSAETAALMAAATEEKADARRRLEDADRESAEAAAQLRTLLGNLGVPPAEVSNDVSHKDLVLPS